MSVFDAVENWAATLRRVAVNHPEHGITAFTAVTTYRPAEGIVGPQALVVGVEPVSDEIAPGTVRSQYDLVTQIMIDPADGPGALDRGQELWPAYWDAIKDEALSDYTLDGTVVAQEMVGRPPSPAIFDHSGQRYVGAEFALRVTVVVEGPATR